MTDDATMMDATTKDIRKFLKKVGITSQQEIEDAIEEARRAGKLEGVKVITATMRLEVPSLDLLHTIESKIALS
ncbi:DUF6494 family protein [Kaarinaea lacus]